VKNNPHSGRFLLLAAAMLTLVLAMWSGLLRMLWALPGWQTGLPIKHGPLMISGFLGILICLERAVALNRSWAYLAPVLTALGTFCFLFGLPGKGGPLLIVLGSAALVADFAAILRRQAVLFTSTMALGAVAWLIGNVLWVNGGGSFVYWWACFLVLTIAGERLELSRLGSHGFSARFFMFFLALYLAGLIWMSVSRVRGLQAAGMGMLLLTFWLARHDIARRTVRLPGLPRFIALHLLAGYFWLAVGALLWMAVDLFQRHAQQALNYDAMLHAIFLGFVFSMIFAHAPIIFPALTGRPLAFRRAFYVHSFVLHLSLLLRIVGDLAGHFPTYRWSGVLNALAIVIFLANNAYAMAGTRRETAKEALQSAGHA
jgi:hypothetical protein